MNYNERRARVQAHEAKLKIARSAVQAESSQIIVSEVWRSGGGIIPRGLDRATLVRRVYDPGFEGFGGTSRYGAAFE